MTVLFIFLALFVGINIRYSIVLGIIELVILILFVFFRLGKKMAIIALGASLLGVGLSFIRPSFNKEAYLSVVVESKDNYYIVNSSFEKLYIYQREHHYEIGDILCLTGEKEELDFSTVESSFDFKDYLNKKGVYSQLYPSKIEVKFRNPLRIHQAKKEFLSHFSPNSRALIGSILFSMSSDEDIYSKGKELHLFRLLSNSGIYLMVIYSGLSFLLGYLIKKEKIKSIVVISLFAPILVFSFPRFVVMKFVFIKLFKCRETLHHPSAEEPCLSRR